MRIAVRPPEYLPRLSYIALMKQVDLLVLADTFQYSRQSFQNRSRIRTPDGWSWLSVPLVGRQHGTPIWHTKLITKEAGPLSTNALFSTTMRVRPIMLFFEKDIHKVYETTWKDLAGLTYATVALFRDLFKIKTNLIRASTLPGEPNTLISVLEQVESGTLVSPVAAFQKDRMVVDCIERFTYQEPEYRQHFEGFEPDITAFDLLCNYGPESIRILENRV